VVIGRNEGERLVRCLRSVTGHGPVVYVDSGSTDASVAAALKLGANVVELDMSKPFTAARARNAGFARLCEILPDIQFVQFVDGDCEVHPDWIRVGITTLAERDRLAIVCGRLREQFPTQSVFNRLADLEWDAPLGDVQSCGGIFLARAHVFSTIGGFHEDVIAGEEPELCSRLLQNGWHIHRLSAPMALHDIAMTRFSQWWRRQVRAGYGGLYTFERCVGHSFRPFAAQIRSARIWVFGWPLVVVTAVLVGMLLDGFRGALLCGAIALSILPAQVLRIAWRQSRRCKSFKDALAYAVFVTVAKLPQIIGQARWMSERRRGVAATIIEHK